MNIGTYRFFKPFLRVFGLVSHIFLMSLPLTQVTANEINSYGKRTFAGVPTGLIRDIEVSGDVVFLAAENGVFKVIGSYAERIPFNQTNSNTGIISDVWVDDGILWIVEYGVGVFRYDLSTGNSKKYLPQVPELKEVWKLVVTQQFIAFSTINGILVVDRKAGSLTDWAENVSPGKLAKVYSLVGQSQSRVFAQSQSYLIDINIEDKQVVLKSVKDDFKKLSEITVVNTHGDKVYLGGPEGLYTADSSFQKLSFIPFANYSSFKKPVEYIYVSSINEIWVAAGGIYKVSEDMIKSLDWMKPMLSSDSIQSIMSISETKDNEILLSSSQIGMVALTNTQRSINYLSLGGVVYEKNIDDVGVDSSGRIFIKDSEDTFHITGDNSTLSVVQNNKLGRCFSRYEVLFEKIYSRSIEEIDFCKGNYNHVTRVDNKSFYAYLETSDGWKYFLFDDNEILDSFDAPAFVRESIVLNRGEILAYDIHSTIHFQLSKYKWKSLTANDTNLQGITCVIELEGFYLICTSGNGLRQINSTNGEISKSSIFGDVDIRFIRGGLLSQAKNLWLATNVGLFIYDTEHDILYDLDSSDGVFDLDFDYRNIHEAQGRVIVIGDRLVYNFDESKLIENLRNNEQTLSRATIYRADWEGEEPHSLDPGYLDLPPTLDSEYGTLSFSVASNSYVESYKHKLEFRILGYIEDWQTHNASSMNLAISDIGYGNFELQARVQSPHSNVEYPINSLHFKINPPFYLSHYAYFLYAILMIMCVYLYRKGYLKLVASMVINTSLVQKVLGRYGAEHKNKIEALAQNKIRLFSNVSHELRTPLQLIMSELGNSKKSDSEKEKLNITALVHNVQRMENLLDQVNTVDKLGTSTLENFRLYSVDDIKIIASSLDSLVKTKRQVLDVSTRGTGTISLLKGSLESIIGNLITNAVKFTENNGIIKFSAVFDEDNLTLSVRDNGKGIDESNHQEIFKRYKRIDPSPEATGEGIGLSLVKELVAMNQGEISVDSALGKGTKFIATFPIDDIQLLNSQNLDESTNSNWEDKPAILLVDDSRQLRNHLFKLFSSTYKCLVARDGKQALDILQIHKVNLVITDLMMPVMSGLNFVEKLRDTDALNYLPIIVLTAKVDDESKERALQANVDCLLTKPIADEELMLRVRHLVALKRAPSNNLSSSDMNKSEDSCILLPELLSEKDMAFYLNFISVLENNYQDEYFTRDKAADLLLISPRSLNRKLSELFDYNFSEFLSRFRIDKSKALLANGASVISVAISVGFAGPSYFSTTFKRIMGIPPKQYSSTLVEPHGSEHQV
ncbi:hybrid sensor histidine kinase/response regulator transcription factor [Alteromonas stellipolaris]|uniref:hybrid sensor histidine kinase/response regulator transcription factor n=1 Tax=Alteromonas stellipolaris TaxID=233316 RepID=UPI001DDC1A00|nr:ATP-binding protein [Alteromonas stellipolaris]MBZ2160526.1 response regulator [Alteromonas stellipolaris]